MNWSTAKVIFIEYISDSFSYIIVLALEWQTLIAGLIALVAAMWTIRTMRRQALDEDGRHKDLMRRKKMAARARMPDALSEVSRYVKEMGCHLLLAGSEGAIGKKPSPPIAGINSLQQVIEHIDNEAAERTFELVSWYQVQRTRTADGIDPLLAVQPIYDLVLLQAYVNSLFDYARNEDSAEPITMLSIPEMFNAIQTAFLLPRQHQNPEIFNKLKEKIDRDHSR